PGPGAGPGHAGQDRRGGKAHPRRRPPPPGGRRPRLVPHRRRPRPRRPRRQAGVSHLAVAADAAGGEVREATDLTTHTDAEQGACVIAIARLWRGENILENSGLMSVWSVRSVGSLNPA